MTVHAFFASRWRLRNALSFTLSILLLVPSFAAVAHPLTQPAQQAAPSAPSAPVSQPKSVSELKVGDIISARNNATGKVGWKQVIHASKRTVSTLLSIQLINNKTSKPAETLVCPLDEAVKLTTSKAIPAGHLAIGKSIVTRAGPICKVKAMFLLRKPGGFVLYDVRVGPLSATNARRLALSQERQVQKQRTQSTVSFAGYRYPDPAASYSAYATAASAGSGTVNPFLFNGQQFDPASNDYYLRARYYDPALGRFLSTDPHEGDPYNPATLHRYSYAGNDPVNYIDPTGRDGELASIGAATAGASVIVAEEEPAIVSSLGDAEGVAGEVATEASGTAETLLQRATDLLVKRWNPFTGPGPLGNLPNAREVINSFRGGSYSEIVTTQTTALYRVFPSGGNALGSYWTRIPPSGPLQSQLDSALLPEWGNTAENVAEIQVPNGTTLYEGFAAAQQGSASLPGGGSQVFIPNVDPSWLVK